MTILVSVAMWNARGTIQRCVDSILAQTYRDFALLVVNDGDPNPDVWEPLAHITDPRLTRVDLPRNVGRYAVDHQVIYGFSRMDEERDKIGDHYRLRYEWWVPVDADDWIEPEYLSRLLAASKGADVVFAPQQVHDMTGRTITREPVKPWNRTAQFRWHAHLSGLWKLDKLRAWGITNPHARVAWDTVMTSCPWVLGTVKIAKQGGYHRVKTPGSLTTDRTTGPGSLFRREAAAKYREAWERIVKNPEQAARIVAGMAPRHGASDLIQKPGMWGDWKLDAHTAAELDRRLHVLQPRVVVECGSGSSTLVLARYARATGAKVVTLEHLQRHHRETARNLSRYRSDVDLRFAPLTDSPPHYDTTLPDSIGFVLIDGPPNASGGRSGVLPWLWDKLDHAHGWEIWLDDAERPEEQESLKQWSRDYPIDVDYPVKDTYAVVTPRIADRDVRLHPGMKADDVVVTILSGGRAELLAGTIGRLPARLLHDATIVALANGADRETLNVFDKHQIEPTRTEQLLPIGPAWSLLARQAAMTPCRYWLHLEDDWRYATLDHGWLADAKDILDNEPAVMQVRLRHHSQRVMASHMVTKRPLVWNAHQYGRTGHAHFTFNPSLVRTDQIAALVAESDAEGEMDLQRRAYNAGLHQVVQLHPGVFVHTGDRLSLRKQTGSPL